MVFASFASDGGPEHPCGQLKDFVAARSAYERGRAEVAVCACEELWCGVGRRLGHRAQVVAVGLEVFAGLELFALGYSLGIFILSLFLQRLGDWVGAGGASVAARRHRRGSSLCSAQFTLGWLIHPFGGP